MCAEMNRFDSEHDRFKSLDERIDGVLQAGPQVVIPAGFAARVAHEAAAQFGRMPDRRLASATIRSGGVGRWAMLGGLVLLVLVMMILARFTGVASVTTVAIESILGVEFAALAVFLGLRPGALR